MTRRRRGDRRRVDGDRRQADQPAAMARGSILDDFEAYVAVLLRLITQQPRVDFASKLPGKRDAASSAIAKQLIEKLRVAGYTITPTPMPPHPHLPMPPAED